MLDFFNCSVDYIDNAIEKMGPIIYDINKDCIGAWHRVKNSIRKYYTVIGKRFSNGHDIFYFSIEVFIDQLNVLEKDMRDNIYTITQIDRYILSYWEKVKNALQIFIYSCISKGIKTIQFDENCVEFPQNFVEVGH